MTVYEKEVHRTPVRTASVNMAEKYEYRMAVTCHKKKKEKKKKKQEKNVNQIYQNTL